MPRYRPAVTKITGSHIHMTDAASFLYMYGEIFDQQIYKFIARSKQPLIIDCGANIGLSIIYFKTLYPESRVVAFEPDRNIFQILKSNIESSGYNGVRLVDKAVWKENSVTNFMPDGADGGRMVQINPGSELYEVSTVRLRDYLKEPVDLLKLDIEGAEVEVLEDCADLINNVSNLFVEYHSFVKEKQTLHRIINILHDASFRIHIHPPHTSNQPFVDRIISHGMDMQLNIFAFRD